MILEMGRFRCCKRPMFRCCIRSEGPKTQCKWTVQKTLRLCKIVSDLDMNFLETGEKDAMKQYMGKLDTCNTSEDKLFALAWECNGFKKLIDMNKELKSTACSLQTRLSVTNRSTNIPKELSQLCQSLLKYVESLYSKKRVAASHAMIFMIADRKIADQKQQQCNKLISEMKVMDKNDSADVKQIFDDINSFWTAQH